MGRRNVHAAGNLIGESVAFLCEHSENNHFQKKGRDMRPEVSIIICTYESDLRMTLRTIYSAIRQKGVSFEIVITDDGSSIDYTDQYREFFQKNNFDRYKIIKHGQNAGTVKNIHDGVVKSEGEYVYAIAPGDFFYNADSLRKILEFARQTNSSFVFGNSRYYGVVGRKLHFYPATSPAFPKLFNKGKKTSSLCFISFFVSNNPIGPSYLRERDEFERLLDVIDGEITYVEDKPTSAMHMLNGNVMRYMDSPIVWYEYGTGISTSKQGGFHQRMLEDEKKMDELLIKLYPDSRVIQAKHNKSLFGRLRYPDVNIAGAAILVLSRIISRFRYVEISDRNEFKIIWRMGKNVPNR